MSLKLFIGNKRYSSWSLRAWLAARLTGEAVEEQMIWLDRPETRAQLLAASPSAKVPVLSHEGRTIWDSLAICLYLDSHFPEAGLLPPSFDTRAAILSVTTEMHAGFEPLRSNMPMDLLGRRPGQGRGPGVEDDIARIDAIWLDCRQRFGADGPYLFGSRPTLADCFFAPVATRFRTYEVALSPVAATYRDTLLDWPLFKEWEAAAPGEPERPEP